MKPQINQISDIQLNDISFDIPYKTDTQIVFPIIYKLNLPLFIQTPELHLCSEIENDILVLPINGKTDETTHNVSNFFLSFDKKILSELRQLIHTGRKQFPTYKWTKKFVYNTLVNTLNGNNNENNTINNTVNNTVNNTINNTINNTDNNVIKLLLRHSKTHQINIYDSSHNILGDIYELNRYIGRYIRIIMELHSVVINDDNIYVYVKTHQLKISKQKIQNYNLSEYSFIDSDDDIDNNNATSDTETLPVPSDIEPKNKYSNTGNIGNTGITGNICSIKNINAAVNNNTPEFYEETEIEPREIFDSHTSNQDIKQNFYLRKHNATNMNNNVNTDNNNNDNIDNDDNDDNDNNDNNENNDNNDDNESDDHEYINNTIYNINNINSDIDSDTNSDTNDNSDSESNNDEDMSDGSPNANFMHNLRNNNHNNVYTKTPINESLNINQTLNDLQNLCNMQNMGFQTFYNMLSEHNDTSNIRIHPSNIRKSNPTNPYMKNKI